MIGGLAAGAIIGGALAGPRYYGYYDGPYAAYPYRPRCYWQREIGWDGYPRRVRVCE